MITKVPDSRTDFILIIDGVERGTMEHTDCIFHEPAEVSTIFFPRCLLPVMKKEG